MAENKQIDRPSVAPAAPVPEVQSNGPKMGFFDTVTSPPDWLTQAYVEAALQKYHNDPKLKISSYSAVPCTKPGDNFVGVIFRTAITYETRGSVKSESFIIKVEAWAEGSKKDLVAGRSYFKVEGRMYMEVLPTMQELLKNIGDKEILAPGLIHYDADRKVLIFQDASQEGFEMVRMPVGLSKASQVAKKIAKFHALSYFLKEELDYKNIDTFNEGMFKEGDTTDWDMMTVMLKVLSDLVREWELNLVADKLAKLTPSFIDKMVQVYKQQAKSKGFNVLNHGDFHIRNLLFKHDAQDPNAFEAIRLIDFQCSVYATPAVDLGFLLYVIADSECREKHRNQLLQTYHEEFKGTLISLGYLGGIPTLLDVQKEMLQHGAMELFAATMFLSIFYVGPETMGDLDYGNPEHWEAMSRLSFEQPEYKEILKTVLPELMYKGLLD